MLDGELSGDELADSIAHLTECSECRGVFEQFRALQDRVEREYSQDEAPSTQWEDIEKKAGLGAKPIVVKFRQNIYKVIAAAAVLVIMFGIGYFSGNGGKLPMQADSMIMTASSPGGMSDERFINFTQELLKSDPKYRVKMYVVLKTLFDESMEGGLDLPSVEEGTKKTQPDENGVYRF